MGKELCFECDEPTGNAGALDDSRMIKGKPYCEDCYLEQLSEKAERYDQLEAALKRIVEAEKEYRAVKLAPIQERQPKELALLRAIDAAAPLIEKVKS